MTLLVEHQFWFLDHVAHDMEFVRDTVAAVHVSGMTCIAQHAFVLDKLAVKPESIGSVT